jgi:hypothetical protein
MRREPTYSLPIIELGTVGKTTLVRMRAITDALAAAIFNS